MRRFQTVRITTIDRLKSTGETEPRESDVGKTVRARLTPEPLIARKHPRRAPDRGQAERISDRPIDREKWRLL